MSVTEEVVVLKAADGHAFDGFIVRAKGSAKGGLVILQEIFGVTNQLKSVARSYAESGFNVVVPALFDRLSPKTVVPFDEAERGRGLAFGLDPEHIKLDVSAAMSAVSTEAGASLMGFCWGGGQAYALACSLDCVSAVAFYGTALKKHIAACENKPSCPMLFHFGTQDDHTPQDVVDDVRAILPLAEIHLYEAGHAFANDVRPAYVADAATSAHARSLEFLLENHAR